MTRFGLVAALALMLLPFGGVTSTPLPLAALPPATAPLTGLVYGSASYRLVQVDPATLAPTRTSVPLWYGSGWVRSPDGKLLALGTGRSGTYETTALQLADPSTLGLVGEPIRFPGVVRAALWSAPLGLYAVVESGGNARLDFVDINARSVTVGEKLGGRVDSYARFAHGLVLVLQQDRKLAPARVAVVYPDGLVRTVPLPRIRAGQVSSSVGHDLIAQMRRPGVAVDDAGSTAYVIDASGLVAAIDLRTLGVTYHRPLRTLLSRIDSWLTPPVEAKGMNGPTRNAQWLGDGLIAVWGANQSDVRKKGVRVVSASPAGLTVLDTHTWRVRTIDERVDNAVIGDGILLTTGARWNSATSDTRTGSGVAAYGADGSLRWRVGDGTAPWISTLYGSVAVVGKPTGKLYDVLDVKTGKILRGSVKGPFPFLLLGEGS